MGTDAQRAAGRKLYEHKCSQCHGEQGDGQGVATAFFRPAPRDFTSGSYKIRTTESGELPTDNDLRRVIIEGMPYTGMPAWSGLGDDEVTNLVYYIKTFLEDFADPDALVPPMDIPKAPRFSEESAEKGRALYEENKCADCHGETGRGNGKSSPTLTDDWDQPIKPADMTKRWTFRGGSTREDIYRTFTTGLNGTPMPSYADLIGVDERWHLVDYVYSLSRDEPEYGTVVVASAIAGDIDLAQGEALFADAAAAFFPVIGQIMEPGRTFYPGANAVEVRAVYNATDIAVMVSWNDMTAEKTGSNDPSMEAPIFDPGAVADEADEDAETFSDAVAIQTPAQNLAGTVKPYFLFGDKKNYVDLWFADLAKNEGELFTGRGSQSIDSAGETIPMVSTYDNGEWRVIFKRPRQTEDGFSFEEGSFAPVAFSIWDGYSGERGNKRGVTAWYHIYMEPVKEESKAIPIAGYGLLTLLIEAGVIMTVRRKNGRTAS